MDISIKMHQQEFLSLAFNGCANYISFTNKHMWEIIN